MFTVLWSKLIFWRSCSRLIWQVSWSVSHILIDSYLVEVIHIRELKSSVIYNFKNAPFKVDLTTYLITLQQGSLKLAQGINLASWIVNPGLKLFWTSPCQAKKIISDWVQRIFIPSWLLSWWEKKKTFTTSFFLQPW